MAPWRLAPFPQLTLVFCGADIPQRPYNVWGTLQDQLTYPDTSGAERLTKEQLHLLLREVDLEYLVDRPGVLTNEINCASRKHLPVGCLGFDYS